MKDEVLRRNGGSCGKGYFEEKKACVEGGEGLFCDIIFVVVY